MATKANPGEWDCYANAEPDEPIFILLARDVAAPDTIREWAKKRVLMGKNKDVDAQIQEAMQCALDMEKYRLERERKKADA